MNSSIGRHEYISVFFLNSENLLLREWEWIGLMKKKVKKVIHCVGVFYLQPNKNKQAGKRTGEHKSGRGVSPNSPHLLLGRRQPTAQLDPRRTFRFQVNTHKLPSKKKKGQYTQASSETREVSRQGGKKRSVGVGRSAHGQTAATDYDEDDECLALCSGPRTTGEYCRAVRTRKPNWLMSTADISKRSEKMMSLHDKLAMESVACIPCSYNHSTTTKLPVFVPDVTTGSLPHWQ